MHEETSLLPLALNAVVIDCRDPKALSDFYVRLLGWVRRFESSWWLDIEHPNGGTRIAFQQNDVYTPPVWPEEEGAQQQMEHLDFRVKDKDQMLHAVEHALSCGATKAPTQYDDKWTVMLDPEGHPFCFVVW